MKNEVFASAIVHRLNSPSSFTTVVGRPCVWGWSWKRSGITRFDGRACRVVHFRQLSFAAGDLFFLGNHIF